MLFFGQFLKQVPFHCLFSRQLSQQYDTDEDRSNPNQERSGRSLVQESMFSSNDPNFQTLRVRNPGHTY